ncbi:hypothetical protein [Pseudoalteromonas arctica]|uniref:Uncharacterized protein n=1 Tax=Pseudoalteromonas arctica TaxID=394751 RepID=A0ABU9TI12_9GAMM
MIIDKGNRLFKLLLSTFFAKVFVSFGGILLSISIGNFYNAEILGDFFIFQLSAITVGVIVSLGMNETLVLFCSKNKNEIRISSFFNLSILLSFSLLSIFSLLFFLYDFNDFPESYSVLFHNKFYFIVSSFFCTFNLLLAGFMRGIKKPAYSVLLENGAVSILCIVILFTSKFILKQDVLNIALMYCLATFSIAFIGFFNLKSGNKVYLRKPYNNEIRSFLKTNNYFFIMVICGLVSTSIISLYLGYILDNESVALFRVIQQVAMLISFSIIILNSAMPAHISGLFRDKSLKNIESLSLFTSKYATLISLPIYIISIFYCVEIMKLFNVDISGNTHLFIILATAQLFNVSTGSVASILKMCGFEVELSKVIILTNVICLILLFALAPKLGVLGAIIASSSILILQNAASLYLVKTKLDISAAFYIRKNDL